MEEHSKQARERRKFGKVRFLLGAMLIVEGFFLMWRVPSGSEYVLPAPSFSAEMSVREKEIELTEKLMEYEWTFALKKQGIRIKSGRVGELDTTVYLIPEDYFEICPDRLLQGDLLLDLKTETGIARAVITQSTANAFFPGMEAIGQMLGLGEWNVEVAGVIQGGDRVGESTETVVYLPASLADTGRITPDIMEIHFNVEGAEHRAILSSILKTWDDRGTYYDYSRLRMSALLPGMLLAYVLWINMLKWSFHKIINWIQRVCRQTKKELEKHYMQEISGKLVVRFISGIIMLSLWIAGCYILLRLMTLPMHTYTDWIPEALVDPDSIMVTVNNLLTINSGASIFRSSTSIRAEWSASLIFWGCLILCSAFIINSNQK